MKLISYSLFLIFCMACQQPVVDTKNTTRTALVILGTLQDAGLPHMGCKKACCENSFKKPGSDKQVISLGLFDAETGKKYLFEASPDMPRQMKTLKNFGVASTQEVADGIFLTHAHIGHYTGLMYLGKESMNAQKATVYAMPRMREFLKNNGPWSQLVAQENIVLKSLENEVPVVLSKTLTVTPFVVPHRDEFSETVGYTIKGPHKSALFIPDIDKWEKWHKSIVAEIKKVDYAFVDATFYSGTELNNRDISQIPHPFIIESMQLFDGLPEAEKNKIIFIHFNHTNPALNPNNEVAKEILQKGYRIGKTKDIFEL